MKKRIYLTEGDLTPDATGADLALVLLGEERHVGAINIPAATLGEEDTVSLADETLPAGAKTAILADLDEQLLLVSSVYRFLLTTPRQLLELQSIGMTVADLHRLDNEESFCTLSSWDQIRTAEQLLLCTTRGFVRGFPLPMMREHVEAPVPFRLDSPLPGLPIAAIAAGDRADLILVSSQGRGWRWPLVELRVTGAQVANCGTDDFIAAAEVIEEGAKIVLLTSDGYARRLLPNWLPLSAKPNSKGRSLVARRSPIAGIAHNESWILTAKGLRRITADHLPLENSTKTFSLAGLDDRQIRAILATPAR